MGLAEPLIPQEAHVEAARWWHRVSSSKEPNVQWHDKETLSSRATPHGRLHRCPTERVLSWVAEATGDFHPRALAKKDFAESENSG